jgi:uncharacterized protein (DUF433 family)
VNDSLLIGAFSEDQVTRLTGVSVNQMRRWARAGLVGPSISKGEPGIPLSRLYSFRDLVSLRVLADLRSDKKVSIPHLKQVAAELAHLGDSKWTSKQLAVLGRRVVIEDEDTGQKAEVVSKQGVLGVPLRVVAQDMLRRVQELNERPEQRGQIVRLRTVAQNQPVFMGTRIPVQSVLDLAGAGYTAGQILAEFPSLSQADVDAALTGRPDAA